MVQGKWEYKTMEAAEPTVSQDQLNAVGKEGWLLVQIYPLREKWIYVFAREY